MANVKREFLHRHWVHSREEDTATETVFRPADFPFPPARGRESFELQAGGSLVSYGIGPTDRRVETKGRWTLGDDDRLSLQRGSSDESSQPKRILALSKDRLVLSK